mmetsp:Transcript_6086/g.17173  ORF Transcript_6086/g.17173 Transcript_6086/m.17173 type:complete len:126 (-) Transcript_6086:171-548(-)
MEGGYNCDLGAGQRQEDWSEQKNVWCCSQKGAGCRVPFDCRAGLENYEQGWSPGAKIWCCENKKVACEEHGLQEWAIWLLFLLPLVLLFCIMFTVFMCKRGRRRKHVHHHEDVSLVEGKKGDGGH